MAAITLAEWGRIYAFIWKMDRAGDSSYMDQFKKDPMTAINRIKNDIPGPKITGTEIFDMTNFPAHGLSNTQLDEIIEGKAMAFFKVGLTC